MNIENVAGDAEVQKLQSISFSLLLDETKQLLGLDPHNNPILFLMMRALSCSMLGIPFQFVWFR